MGDSFKPLRMKVGVVTLIMACGVMFTWVYSFDGDLNFNFDQYVGMEEGPGSSGFRSIGIYQHALELRVTRSTPRRVETIQNLDPATLASYIRMTVIYEDSDQSSVAKSQATTDAELPEPEKDALAVDFELTKVKRTETMYFETLEKMEKVFSIPLWSVAIPLTLLSVYLLLSKPQTPNPEREKLIPD